MATVKIVLRKKSNKDGTFPLTFSITKDRKSSYIRIGYQCRGRDWDAKVQRVGKLYLNASCLNALIAKKLAEADTHLCVAVQMLPTLDRHSELKTTSSPKSTRMQMRGWTKF